MCYPIKNAQVEFALQSLNAQEVYLCCSFSRQNHMWKEDRDRATVEGRFELLTLTLERDMQPDRYERITWKNLCESDSMELFAHGFVHAIERGDMKDSGLRQNNVADVLRAEVSLAEEKGRLSGDCVIELLLDVKARCLRSKRIYRREYIVERSEEAVYELSMP